MKIGREKKKTLAKFYFDIAKIVIALVILKSIMENAVNLKNIDNWGNSFYYIFYHRFADRRGLKNVRCRLYLYFF